LLCLMWRCELLSRPDRRTGAFCLWSVSECVGRRSATAGRTPTQNALVGLSGRLKSHSHTRQEKTVAPACRPPPPRRRPGRQCTPPPDRPHAATLHDTQKCKHCCIGPNFFTKRHATRANYRFNSSDFARRSRDSIHTA